MTTVVSVCTGSQVRFSARFPGRTLTYTYRFVEVIPGKKLVMRTSQGPFPMETTYTREKDGAGTRMTLRNSGKPSGRNLASASPDTQPFRGRCAELLSG